jgi:hypothetical protein
LFRKEKGLQETNISSKTPSHKKEKEDDIETLR